MANISAWSTTAADNNSATPDGYPEGQSPGSLNDCGRELMAAVRRWYEAAQWLDFGHTPTKVDSDTFTVAGDQTSIYDAGRRVRITGSASGYGTISSSSYSAPNTTVNLTSGVITGTLTAVAVGVISGTNSALPATQAGSTVWTSGNDGSGSGLDADTVDGIQAAAFAQVTTGSFTGTLTGFASGPTGTINYRIVGNICHLYGSGSNISGTSNADTLTLTGLPVAVRPTNTTYAPATPVLNNGVLSMAHGLISAGGSVVTLVLGTDLGNSSVFNSNGTKGLGAGWQMSYPLS